MDENGFDVDVLDEEILEAHLDQWFRVQQTMARRCGWADQHEQEGTVHTPHEGPGLLRKPLGTRGPGPQLGCDFDSGERGRTNGDGLRLSHEPRLFWGHLTPFSARTSFLRFTRRAISPG